jgi:FecR protein
MNGWRRPALAWLAVAVYLLPATAFAQATKAGVVTTLEGNVTAARAVAPQPVVLKFKDDVYLQDRVVTGEQSFARLLLGGKAVVSIRERSAVTITEVPGRSTIDIESGKIALSVARDRMQPGEVINIKTPNAVAGVRGTVVVAQVAYSLVGGAQQPVSNLWVLRGVIEAVHTNAAGVAIGVPVPVGAMQSFSATPTAAATGTFTLQQMSGIVQGLQAKGAADPGTASQAPARLEAVNTAVALLTALIGSPAVQQLATGTPQTLTTPPTTTPNPGIDAVAAASNSPTVLSLPELPPPPAANMATLQSGQNLLVFTGNQVQSSDGTPIVPTTDPLLSRTGFTITQQGPDDLIVARPDTNVALPGPLLKLTDTSVQAGDAFLSVAGHVTSTSPQPFIDFDPTTVTAPGNLVEVVGPNGALGLAGTLVKDTGGTVNVGGSVVSVSEGGTITSTGQGPLVQLNGTTMTASSLLSVVGSGSTVRLGGPLLNVVGGSLNVGRRVVGVFGGSQVSTAAGDALVSLVNGNHVLGTDPGSAAFMVGDPGSRLTVPGGLLALNGAIVTMAGPFLQITPPGVVNAAGPLLDMTGGGLSSNTTNAFIGISGSPATPGALTAQQLVRLTSAANLVLHGSLVSVLDTSLTATDSSRAAFAITDGASLSTTATASPLFVFTGSAFGSSQVTVARQLLELTGARVPSLNLSGPLLTATNTIIRTGDPAANPFGLVFLGDSATLTSATSAPLLSFVNSTADLAGAVVSVRRSTSINSPTSMTLSGPLISASNSAITTTSLGFDAFFGTTGQTCCSVMSIRQGARLTTTADLPLIQLSNSTLNDGPDARSGGTIFILADSLVGTAGELVAPSTANLAGPLLTTTNSNVSALFNLIQITNSTLTSTTTSPLVTLSGGSLTLGGPNPLADGALTFARGLSLSGAGAVLSLQGPLFAFSNMNATSTGEMLGVFNSSLLTSTTLQALIQLSSGTFTTGPTANFMSIASSAGLSPSMQLAGPLISATNAILRNGDPTISVPQTLATLHAFTFIGDSAQVRSTSTQPLFDFNGVSLTSSGSVMSLRRSLTTAAPTRLTLDGPLLRALNNTTIDVTSLALGSACCSVFDVEQAAQLVSTTTTALIQLSSSVMNNGPDAQSGGTLFFVADAGGVADGPIAASPALVSLSGPLFSSVNSKLSSLFSLVGVTRSTLKSTSPDALIQLNGFAEDVALQAGGVDPFVALPNNQTRTGRVLSVLSSASSGTVGDAALVSLAGPLLRAVSAPIQLTGDVIGVFNGARVDSTSTSAFIQLSGETTTLVAGATDPGSGTVVNGRLVFVSGIGGPDGVTPATLTLSGPVLRAEAGSVIDTNSKGLSLFTDGALVTRAPPVGTSYPLLQVDASSLSVGGTSGTGRLFEITGAGPLQADPNTNPVTGAPSTLQFGQQRPLQHNGRGALLEASNGAFVNVRGANGAVLRLDTALLDATAPIFVLTGTGTRLQTSGNGIDLANNARLQTTNANDALVRIDSQARMDVLAGHLVSVSASRLNVAGDLVRMSSNTLLNVTNGVLLSVLNGGIANINGALVSFTGVGGMINVTNTLAPTAFITGIPVNVAPGGNIAIGAGALAGLNVNNNTIRINGTALPTNANANSGITGSLISVGANGTVRVAGSAN